VRALHHESAAPGGPSRMSGSQLQSLSLLNAHQWSCRMVTWNTSVVGRAPAAKSLRIFAMWFPPCRPMIATLVSAWRLPVHGTRRS
jgi:hypothetical protein